MNEHVDDLGASIVTASTQAAMAYLGDPTAADAPHYLDVWAKYLRGLDPVAPAPDHQGTRRLLVPVRQPRPAAASRPQLMLDAGVDMVGVFLSNPFTAAARHRRHRHLDPRPRLTPTRRTNCHDQLRPARARRVIAVHLQNDIVGADGAFARFFRAEIDRTGVLATISRCSTAPARVGVKVVYTRVAWQPGYPDLIANSPLLAIVAQTKCLVDGTPRRRDRRRAEPRRPATSWSPTSGSAASTPASSTSSCAAAGSTPSSSPASPPTSRSRAPPAPPPTWATAPPRRRRLLGRDTAAHAASLESLGLLAEIVTTDELLAGLGVQPAAVTP